MRTTIGLGVSLLVLAACATGAKAGIVAFNSTALYNIDSVTGVPSFRAITSLANVLDLACCDKANTVYATTLTALYEVNVNTGAVTLIGNYHGATTSLDTLGFGPFNNLYGVRADSAGLWQINRQTAETTFIGNHGYTNLWAMAYIPGGGMQVVSQDEHRELSLALSTGAASSIGLTGADRITDIAYDDVTDSVIGVANGPTRIYRLNKHTGAATLLQSYGLYSFLGAAEFHSTALVSGHVALGHYLNSPASQSVTVEIKQSGVVVQTEVLPLDGAGNFTFATNKRGAMEISAKASHWLRQTISGINLTDAGLTGLAYSLPNGDINNDNEVGIGDYAQLSTAYNSFPGDNNWNSMADLNGDDEVSIGDYAILSTNFGLFGDD